MSTVEKSADDLILAIPPTDSIPEESVNEILEILDRVYLLKQGTAAPEQEVLNELESLKTRVRELVGNIAQESEGEEVPPFKGPTENPNKRSRIQYLEDLESTKRLLSSEGRLKNYFREIAEYKMTDLSLTFVDALPKAAVFIRLMIDELLQGYDISGDEAEEMDRRVVKIWNELEQESKK